MMTKKLLMFAVAGLLAPAGAYAAPGIAGAEGKTFTILAGPINDTAPISNGRLRRTNEEQAGTEMTSVVVLKDPVTGKFTKGLYFAFRTELPPATAGGTPRRANDRAQGALVTFDLGQDALGKVVATNIDQMGSTFITDNDGNEYRNFNSAQSFALTDDIACVEYNYQPNNTNDTRRYSQCFGPTGINLMAQTQIMAKNNDDCAMQQHTKQNKSQRVGNKIYVTAWMGCNGNGNDDGWQEFSEYTLQADGKVTYAKMFDISLAQREERSRGFCSTSKAKPNTAICTWTEGNNQPQRDGTWIAAVNITPGAFSGNNQQGALLWKEQIDGRNDIEGQRTYSMRAAHTRIQAPSATGELEDTGRLLFYSNRLRGNNQDNQKGGQVVQTTMAILEADETGVRYVMPLQDTAAKLRGLGGTHLGMNPAMFGTTDKLVFGAIFTNGSHTGGYFSGQARAMIYDETTAQFIDGGMVATAPSDRHLYSNYLGNNPGNQGRNHDDAITISNPFLGVNGNTDAHLMLIASSGKPMEEVGMPQIKTSAFVTIVPLSKAPAGATGSGSGSGSGSGEDPIDPEDPDAPGAGDSLGGCSTGGTTGLATFLLIGLAAFIRRRR